MIQRISANVSINEISSDAFIQETSLSITQFCAHSTVLDDNPLKRDFRKGVYIYMCKGWTNSFAYLNCLCYFWRHEKTLFIKVER